MRIEYFFNEPDFKAENINILEVERPKGFKHHFKLGRPKHGFIYTVKGEIEYIFYGNDKKSITLRAGEVIFVPKGCVYSGIYTAESTKLKIVQFDISDGNLPKYLLKPTAIQLPNIAELIECFFKKFESHNATFYYLHCFYNMMWQIDENYFSLPKKYKKLQPALTEITEYWNKNEAVLYYAELCDMSEVSFRRNFKEFTGKAPLEYRNDIRLNNAKIMLQSGQYTVSETAEACGFSNLSFFTRLYKKKYGHTPKKV